MDPEQQEKIFAEVQDENDEIIGVCIECHSDQPEAYMERQLDKEWQFGNTEFSVPCKFCGGVARIVNRGNRDHFIAIQDRRRGIYTPPKDHSND